MNKILYNLFYNLSLIFAGQSIALGMISMGASTPPAVDDHTKAVVFFVFWLVFVLIGALFEATDK